MEKLSRALAPQASASKPQRQEDDKNIRQFERLIRPSEKFAECYADNQTQDENEIKEMLKRCKVDKDPIVHWLRYIKYHEDAYPSDTHSQFLLKERCTQSLLHHPKSTNDVRFIRVCVLYADRTDDPHEQFKFFHTHKVGSEVAIFWLAWAWVAEKKKDFQFADKIFRKAVLKKAQPVKVVNERYKQFQRRMSRHWLNSNANNPESVYDEENEGKQNSRGALSGLTEEGVRQNHRGRGANAIASRPLTASNGQTLPSTSNNGAPAPQAGGFQIFAEDDQDDEGGYDLNQPDAHGDENAPLPRLVTQQDRKKENTLGAEAWNERGGLHGHGHAEIGNDDDRGMQGASSVVSRWAGTGGDSMVAGGTSGVPAFQVFVDETCADKEEASVPRKHGRLNDRSLRQRLDEDKVPNPKRFVRSTSGSSSEGTDQSHKRQHSSKPPQAKSTRNQETTDAPKSKAGKVPLGFDKKLISKDRNGRERCFEEHRAKARCYKLRPASRNFNLLHKMPESCSMSIDSCMDVDDASTIEEVDMMDISRSMSMIREVEDEGRIGSRMNVPTLQSTVYDSEVKKPNPKKVLFGLNTSIVNRSASRAHNSSTASSTVDERDAVGAFGDREETLNTKFAARELSMMFSSPSGLMNQSVAPSSKKTSDRLLFSMHQDESYTSLESSSRKDGGKDAFAIFCEDEEADGNGKPKRGGGGFAIFEEGDEDDSAGPSPNTILKSGAPAVGFDVYQDDSDSEDSFDEDASNGDTASLADLADIMKDISPTGKPMPLATKGSSKPSGGFAIFNDDGEESEKDLDMDDNGTLLTEDTAAFGDLSYIASNADGDTCNLQNKMKGMSLSRRR